MTNEMSCQELVELVTEYLDGALDVETRKRFVAHLADCRGCENYLEQFRSMIRELGRLPAESLSAHVRTRLLDSFRDWHDH